MNPYFPQPYKHSGVNLEFWLDLSNYETKSDLKEATDIDTSTLELKADFVSLETKIDNLDVDRLKTVHADIS